ncbi:SDR family oxidoreductase [Pontibacillus sp. ALD_SL1]|uniref:SDR family oxidoreductase n=1 Tax=Pontibacillus sp. ALD_SL1 TaxID=2777185 RepID=UPI001A97428F|nr:SDR family oxidoreductase [Pontibacillus sp. ALD_SL1]QSS98661.1 SDR family oxidoreductase [Pontibacillus sp. ALD_SL1]
MDRTYFVTGFPGFISSKLIQKLLVEDPNAQFELLVYKDQYKKAAKEMAKLVQDSRFTLIKGDITLPDLGMDQETKNRLYNQVTHVFHLAAIYDLAVPEDLAYQVNVIGTEHVVQFVRQLSSLERFVYFSTAFVSGDRSGEIFETELECGQSFKNHYEATKYEAEVRVQRYMPELPTTIIRPGIVMGDSQTGETAKFDGPYFVMRFLDKFARIPIPYIGRGAALINLVPIDYVVNATVFLAHNQSAAGRVYHLTDPNPLTAREAYRLICETLLGKKPSYTLPTSVVYKTLSVPSFRRWVQVERETLDYFQLKAVYNCNQSYEHLKGSGIECPNLADYLQQEVAYYKEHRHEQDKLIQVN